MFVCEWITSRTSSGKGPSTMPVKKMGHGLGISGMGYTVKTVCATVVFLQNANHWKI